jgi:TRAP-type C4-dicarboxylate transport system substrate-binding protein
MARRSSGIVAITVTSSMILAGCVGQADSGAEGDCGEAKLTLSHQWPAPAGQEGDFRSVLAQRFADQVSAETNGQVTVQLFPNSSLVDSTEQYDAILKGVLDMSVFPLAYAAGRVPEFDISAMPAIVRSHDEAQAWQEAEIGQRLQEITEENGSKIVTWVWNAGAIGTKGSPIVAPDDIRPGMTIRSGFAYHDRMLESAGAGISGMPSNEIYTGMQTGVLDAAVTSTGSFASFKLQEQVDSLTSPSMNTFWFLFEPLIIGTEAFDALCGEQQDAGVEVLQMEDAKFEQWRELAQKQWRSFAGSVNGGQELLDLAQKVSGK